MDQQKSSDNGDITKQQSDSLHNKNSFFNFSTKKKEYYSSFDQKDNVWVEHCFITAYMQRNASNEHLFKGIHLPTYVQYSAVCVKCRLRSCTTICEKCQHEFNLSAEAIQDPNKRYITTMKLIVEKTADVPSSSSIDTINTKDGKETKKLEEEKADNNIDECESKNIHSEQHEVNQENKEIEESLSDNEQSSSSDDNESVPSASGVDIIYPQIIIDNPNLRCTKLY
ncbi:uncharacterized protein LOC113558692 [Rhopalosiphum maidis]|uniref:uncharacterized protein LOC113558692 n=1 Tax=Rhopalosiphum maidis TaxID=43146 RepID=UPI000EFFDDB8|nr:uncharacterized protein LOC113558692 [Rhopalosiphum maidis]